MFDSEEKTIALIVKLNRLTSIGEIKWAAADPPASLVLGTDDRIPLFMGTFYKGKMVGLYLKRFQDYDGERDRLYWSERVVLAIFDQAGRCLWETFSQYSALMDLYETVRRKVSSVDEFIDELLSDEKGDDQFKF